MDYIVILLIILIVIALYFLYKIDSKLDYIGSKSYSSEEKNNEVFTNISGSMELLNEKVNNVIDGNVKEVRKTNTESFVQFQKIIALNNQPVLKKTNYFTETDDISINVNEYMKCISD